MAQYVTRRELRPVRQDLTVYLCTHNHRFLVLGHHALWLKPNAKVLLVPDYSGQPEDIGWNPRDNTTHLLAVYCACSATIKRDVTTRHARPETLEAAMRIGGPEAAQALTRTPLITQHLVRGGTVYFEGKIQ